MIKIKGSSRSRWTDSFRMKEKAANENNRKRPGSRQKQKVRNKKWRGIKY